ARAAAGLPEVSSALRAGRYDDLERVEGGKQFLSALREYLDEFGWQAESWGLPHIPTWAEDPHTPLLLIARYLDDPNLSPDAAIQRSQHEHDEAMRELESRLSGHELAEMKARLAACEGHVPISEGRATWQLTIIGSVRVPLLALGRKLVQAGVLDDPNDVFFFDVEELKKAALGPSPSYKETAAARKAALAAAVVTDTGDILSHSAICAREYGIPCVAGTQVGTSQIPDGAMVTVDGAEGTVRIEG